MFLPNIFILFFTLRCFLVLGEVLVPGCGVASRSSWTVNLSVRGKRTQVGDLVNFSVFKDSRNSTSEWNLEVTQNVTECGGRHLVHIKGVIKENSTSVTDDCPGHDLLFHPNCGTNVAVINKRRTARKINTEENTNGVVLTNRPLNVNELFEIKLEIKGSKFGDSMGIGVTTHSPNDHKILPHMNSERTGTWMLYGPNLWNNGKNIKPSYAQNTYNLGVGSRVGVKRRENGVLHFYVNGADQGPAAADLPHNLYGVFELYGDAQQVTIIGS